LNVFENVRGSLGNRVAISYRSTVISSSGLGSAILNPWSAKSGDIGIVRLERVMIENVWVAVETLYVCRWKLKLHRPAAENFPFFMESAFGFQGLTRHLEEQRSRGKRQNIRNWTHKEMVLTLFKFDRLAKISFFPSS